ncbi:MAG: SRPBCC domain-containing protein [Rhizobiaceae bacterium]|nr:SRPBCC domain-containing protein [Rhizobiaceae bacterium]MCV0405089.1 SRPBCC domain-containing protein [Rhizobiaceae bacterium]
MKTDRNVSIKVVRRFEASAERVFDAWLDPEIARKWLFRTEGGEMVTARIDARVGGSFDFTERRDGQDVAHVGEYLVIERPTRLVFTFGVPLYSPEFDRVTVEIVRQGRGCELTLTNDMTPEIFAEWGEKTQEGWTTLLASLARELGEEG